MPPFLSKSPLLLALAAPLLLAVPARAQDAPAAQAKSCKPQGMFALPDYTSVEVLADGTVTFRLCAPDANDVRVTSPDIAGVIPQAGPPGSPPAGLAMTKDATGLWSATTAKPVPPDNYRYDFQVDGVSVPDPMATRFVHERAGADSIFEVKGAAGDFQAFDPKVPHGAVSEIDYWSNSLGFMRRAMVYTPPGYMKGNKSYPVLYLVHGAGDSEEAWSRTGHAQYILDNLIAAGKARPMIVVMPNGHTPDRPGSSMLDNTDFGNDFLTDLIPYVDAHFRTVARADSRAMAGLSMGGLHTINFGLTHPELFHWIGIFSSGLGLGGNMDQFTRYEQANDAALKQDARDLKLVYYAMGKDDPFFAGSVTPMEAMFAKYGIKYVYHPSEGAHTWINWRRYLEDFAPRLFR